MVVWGGFGVGDPASGGRYDPSNDTWTTTTTTGAPTGRFQHTAAWTGSTMIVWGGVGSGGTTYFNDGARYNPGGDAWTPVSLSGAPAARSQHTAVWTGTEMIVWGGYGVGQVLVTGGGRYDPTGNSWLPVSTTGAPGARAQHSAVWTGSDMVVWGGYDGSSFEASGGRYSPASNQWSAVSAAGSPSPRASHAAVWTGTEMIVFGGATATSVFDDTFAYTPGRVMYLYQRP
jgi:N-acetylneuraminic acid mutarotase